MMTRRSFVAAMATVPVFKNELVFGKTISSQVFDWRGQAWIQMYRNTFKCCRFIVDEKSAFITLTDNAFSSCQFEGFETADYISLGNNVFYNSGQLRLGVDCKPPRGLSNKAYGNEMLEDGPPDVCEVPQS